MDNGSVDTITKNASTITITNGIASKETPGPAEITMAATLVKPNGVISGAVNVNGKMEMLMKKDGTKIRINGGNSITTDAIGLKLMANT